MFFVVLRPSVMIYILTLKLCEDTIIFAFLFL